MDVNQGIEGGFANFHTLPKPHLFVRYIGEFYNSLAMAEKKVDLFRARVRIHAN